jgi:hypothetical protein
MSALGELLADLASGDNQRAESAANALPEHGQPALEKLTELLLTSEPDKRWWIARTLAGFSEPEAGLLLTNLLDDPDPSVRYCAVLAVGKHHHHAAISKLIRALDSDDSLLVRLAADALISIGVLAVEPLLAALDASSASASVEAARALALIGDTRAIPALFKFLDSDSVMLQHWANEGLEKMGVGMDFFKP